MKQVHIIESIEDNKTEWLISLTDNNPDAADCFTVTDGSEAARIKAMLEKWVN